MSSISKIWVTLSHYVATNGNEIAYGVLFTIRSFMHARYAAVLILGYLLDSVIHVCGMLRDKGQGKAKCLCMFSLKSSNIPDTWMALSC